MHGGTGPQGRLVWPHLPRPVLKAPGRDRWGRETPGPGMPGQGGTSQNDSREGAREYLAGQWDAGVRM